MSILQDCQYTDIDNFQGPNLLLDEEDIRSPQALSGRNVEYVEGQVHIPRRGFKQVWNPNVLITVMYNWLQQQYNRLMLLIPSLGLLVSRDLQSVSNTTILTGLTGAAVATFAQAGYRIYTALATSAGLGYFGTTVYDGSVYDQVFRAPPSIYDATFNPTGIIKDGPGSYFWATVTNNGAGSVTNGNHLICLIATTKAGGYQMAPGPLLFGASGVRPGEIAPELLFYSGPPAGNYDLTIAVNPQTTWPAWLYSLQLAVTPVINPLANTNVSGLSARWFLVPGAIAYPVSGSSTAQSFSLNISDVTLLGGGPTEITNTLFSLYHATTSDGLSPTIPHCVLAYNNRTVYLTRLPGLDGTSLIGTIFISEPEKPQYVTANQHMRLLPEGRDTVTAFALGGTLFVLGPSWTYAFVDNLRVPVLWAPPRLVSESIGSPFITGVSVNQSKGYAWVGDHTGLFYFTGSNYPVLPSSYWQKPDWDRINFAAGQETFKIIDSPDDRLLVVRAALDGALTCTHMLVWDYTNGVTPDKIRYCGLWNLEDYATIGDIAVVQDYTTKIKQLWISGSDGSPAGDVKRLKSIESGDASKDYPNPLYDDDGVGIDGGYQLVAVSRAADGPQMQIGGRFRIRGAGQLSIKAYSFDQQRESVLEPITAAENSLQTGQRFDRFLDEQTEVVSYEVTNNAQPGVFAWWAALRAYYIPWMNERGEDNQ